MPTVDLPELRKLRAPAQPTVEAIDSWGNSLKRWTQQLGAAAWRLVWLSLRATRNRLLLSAPPPSQVGLRLVLISDTHGQHRRLKIPEGDVLIHGGDFTRMGAEEDLTDFNAWLGEQPHRHKIVVNGNHECNAPWKNRARAMLSNATLLKDSAVTLEGPGGRLRVYGTDFAWPMKSYNPSYEAIEPADVLICHGPVLGYADGGKGCAELLRLVRRLRPGGLRLVVSGHIHAAHARVEGAGALRGTTFVNAANASRAHTHMGWAPEVVDL